jgi:hypothetical protein
MMHFHSNQHPQYSRYSTAAFQGRNSESNISQGQEDDAPVTPAARSRPVEYEARNILASGGYHASRFSGSHSPVNIIGFNTEDLLLVQVRRARRPPGSIAEINATFRNDMDSIRRIGGPRFCRKELWLYNLQEGWRYFEVFPGGMMELPEPRTGGR